MSEAVTTPFVMHGTRTAMAAGLGHVERHVHAIEQAVDENPGLAFDLAKTLIESACKTVLKERGIPYSSSDSLPRLFKQTTGVLSFLPESGGDAAKAAKSLKRTLSGLSTAVQGVCELRNSCGFASHGADSPRPAMEAVQALLAAATADTIVGFLHRVHAQDRTPPPGPTREFDANAGFNDLVDSTHEEIRIFESEFRASEVLFLMEPETYRIYLAEFVPESDDVPEEAN